MHAALSYRRICSLFCGLFIASSSKYYLETLTGIWYGQPSSSRNLTICFEPIVKVSCLAFSHGFVKFAGFRKVSAGFSPLVLSHFRNDNFFFVSCYGLVVVNMLVFVFIFPNHAHWKMIMLEYYCRIDFALDFLIELDYFECFLELAWDIQCYIWIYLDLWNIQSWLNCSISSKYVKEIRKENIWLRTSVWIAFVKSIVSDHA